MEGTGIFSLNLTVKPYEILEYTKETLADDLEYFGVKRAEDLEDEDFKVFRDADAALTWLDTFKARLNGLTRIANAEDALRDRPAMLLRRVDLARVAMGEKKSTARDTNFMKWKAGDRVRFHDQTFTVPVRVKRVERKCDHFVFHFELE